MENVKYMHRQPNVMVACAQAHVAQARDCIGNNTTIQSLACATCACAQATITLGCLWYIYGKFVLTVHVFDFVV